MTVNMLVLCCLDLVPLSTLVKFSVEKLCRIWTNAISWKHSCLLKFTCVLCAQRKSMKNIVSLKLMTNYLKWASEMLQWNFWRQKTNAHRESTCGWRQGRSHGVNIWGDQICQWVCPSSNEFKTYYLFVLYYHRQARPLLLTANSYFFNLPL